MTTFPSLCRTKALVLELLAAVCLVRGGHDIILAAFDNFKEVLELSPLNQPISQQTCSCFLVFLGAVLLAAVASAGDVGWTDIWGAQGGDDVGWGNSEGKTQGHTAALPGVTGTSMGIC